MRLTIRLRGDVRSMGVQFSHLHRQTTWLIGAADLHKNVYVWELTKEDVPVLAEPLFYLVACLSLYCHLRGLLERGIQRGCQRSARRESKWHTQFICHGRRSRATMPHTGGVAQGLTFSSASINLSSSSIGVSSSTSILDQTWVYKGRLIRLNKTELSYSVCRSTCPSHLGFVSIITLPEFACVKKEAKKKTILFMVAFFSNFLVLH